MNDNSKLAKPIRSLSSLVRPKYSPGLLLQDDDLTAAVSYTRNLSRLMFRTLFGCGVLCGLKVHKPKLECGKLCFEIDKGNALSCLGDPIEVNAAQQVCLDPCEALPCRIWFAIRLVEACCVPRSAQCSPDEEEPPAKCTRERDGFEIRVFANRPPCSCGCRKLGPPKDTQDAAANAKSKKKAPKPQENTAAASAGVTKTSASAIDDACKDAEILPLESGPKTATDDCLCNLRTAEGACYHDFYNGECACDCCDCEWIILALAERDEKQAGNWLINHSVRRFVRPVLMRDPLA